MRTLLERLKAAYCVLTRHHYYLYAAKKESYLRYQQLSKELTEDQIYIITENLSLAVTLKHLDERLNNKIQQILPDGVHLN